MKTKYLFLLFWQVDPVVFGFAIFSIILSVGMAFFDAKTAFLGITISCWMLLYVNEEAKGAIIFQKYIELLKKGGNDGKETAS